MQAGIQKSCLFLFYWIPVFTGMTAFDWTIINDEIIFIFSLTFNTVMVIKNQADQQSDICGYIRSDDNRVMAGNTVN